MRMHIFTLFLACAFSISAPTTAMEKPLSALSKREIASLIEELHLLGFPICASKDQISLFNKVKNCVNDVANNCQNPTIQNHARTLFSHWQETVTESLEHISSTAMNHPHFANYLTQLTITALQAIPAIFSDKTNLTIHRDYIRSQNAWDNRKEIGRAIRNISLNLYGNDKDYLKGEHAHYWEIVEKIDQTHFSAPRSDNPSKTEAVFYAEEKAQSEDLRTLMNKVTTLLSAIEDSNSYSVHVLANKIKSCLANLKETSHKKFMQHQEACKTLLSAKAIQHLPVKNLIIGLPVPEWLARLDEQTKLRDLKRIEHSHLLDETQNLARSFLPEWSTGYLQLLEVVDQLCSRARPEEKEWVRMLKNHVAEMPCKRDDLTIDTQIIPQFEQLEEHRQETEKIVIAWQKEWTNNLIVRCKAPALTYRAKRQAFRAASAESGTEDESSLLLFRSITGLICNKSIDDLTFLFSTKEAHSSSKFELERCFVTKKERIEERVQAVIEAIEKIPSSIEQPHTHETVTLSSYFSLRPILIGTAVGGAALAVALYYIYRKPCAEDELAPLPFCDILNPIQ